MSPRHAIEGPAARSATLRAGFALVFVFVLVLAAAWPLASRVVAQAQADRCLVPPAVRDAVLNEVSGERAHLHVQMLAANRDRQADEYQNAFFETTYIRDMAKQAGLSDVQVDFFPSRDTWDAEEGDLWMVQPTKKKIASLTTGARPRSRRAAGTPTSRRRSSTSARDARPTTPARTSRGRSCSAAGRSGSVFVGASTCAAPPARSAPAAPASARTAPGYTLDQIGWSSVVAAAGHATASASRSRCASSSNCATCSTAARRSSSGRTFARARTRAR